MIVNPAPGAYRQPNPFPLLHGLIILGYGIFASLPGLTYCLILAHDSLSHLVISRNFVHQLWAGDIYPRWLFELNAGLGSPVFHYYGPIPYYVTALLHPVIGNDPDAWQQLGATAALAIIASGFSAYTWLKSFCSANAALIGALLYMTAPYHLAIDLYQRFALAELWGFVWMPLILLQAEILIDQRNKSIAGLAIAYALLISTHLATTLIFSPILLIYPFFKASDSPRNPALVKIVTAMLLGIGLSSIYLLPAMATQADIRLSDQLTGYFYFGQHFLFANTYPSQVAKDFSENVANITLITASTSLLVFMLGYRELKSTEMKLCIFWAAIMTISIFMMHPFSQGFWQILKPLQTIQFPWRLSTIVTISSTILIAHVISASLTTVKHRAIIVLTASLPMLLISLPAIYGHIALARDFGSLNIDRLIEMAGNGNGEAALRLESTKINRYEFFLPKDSAPSFFPTTPSTIDVMKRLGIERVRMIGGNNKSARIKNWEHGHILLDTSLTAARVLIVNQFYFPGWIARIVGQTSELALTPSQPEGLLQMEVPPGVHEIEITLETTNIERWGQILSAVSILIVAFMIVPNRFVTKSETK